MQDGSIGEVRKAKENVQSLKDVALVEVLLYIDQTIKTYENQRKA